MKTTRKFLKIVGIVIAIVWSVAALTRLWDEYTSGGASGLLLAILNEYELITGGVFRWLEPPFVAAVGYLADLTGWNLTVVPFWKDILALLALYLGAQVSDVHERKRYPKPIPAVLGQGAWAAVCVLATTLLSGAPLAGVPSGTVIVAISLAGIVIHRLGFAVLWAMNRERHFGEPFSASFMKKAWGAAAIALFGFGVCVAGSRVPEVDFLGQPIGPSFVVLLAVLLVLAVFHIAPGIVEYLRKGRLERNEGNVLIGIKIFGTIILTLCAIVGLT